MDNFEAIKKTSQNLVLDILQHLTQDELVDNQDIFSLGVDSINAMMLILKLQDTFSVGFEANEISFDNFRTIGNIAELIARKKGVDYMVANVG